jgi:hypothetical protein
MQKVIPLLTENTILTHFKMRLFNPLNAELNPICHLLALLGTHHILYVSRIRVNAVVEIMAVCS